MCCFNFGEILLRQTVADGKVRILREKAEVTERIHLWPVELVLVQLRFRKNMMYLQPTHFTKQVGFQWQSCAPIACASHAREEIEDRIESSAKAPSRKMSRLDTQSTMPQSELIQ